MKKMKRLAIAALIGVLALSSLLYVEREPLRSMKPLQHEEPFQAVQPWQHEEPFTAMKPLQHEEPFQADVLYKNEPLRS
jgi:hypothetical protein